MFISPSRVKDICLFISTLFIFYLLVHRHRTPSNVLIVHTSPTTTTVTTPTTLRHLLFSIASSSKSFPNRKPYLRLWCNPNSTRAFVFLDRPAPNPSPSDATTLTLPPILVSANTSKFPYTFPRGSRSAVRIARIVKEAVDRNESNVRWFIFGDDDTVFFTDNLVKTLSKYDHDRWYYVGSYSESYDQTQSYSFDMAFGGGGFAISHSLAKVLAGVLDSCLMRYSYLFGSDARVFSCLAELGVGLTHELGFHQVDLRGDLFGMLSAHPLSPLVSLHHLGLVEPIFPNTTRIQALEHLFKAVNVDPARILQQTVCYDRSKSLTVSVAWGYAVQVFEGNHLLPELLSWQRTFRPWRRTKDILLSLYMFNTREYPKDPCKRAVVFFLESVVSDVNRVWTNYTRHIAGNCSKIDALQNLEQIRVFSQKLHYDIGQLKAPRRECCDITPSFGKSMVINIRQCGVDELISMHT
uniref:Transferring glycosyl group transferase n=1 Tax=Davidia involucrata TaxID=16924 RepID=A0A5B7BY65_DAVIN